MYKHLGSMERSKQALRGKICCVAWGWLWLWLWATLPQARGHNRDRVPFFESWLSADKFQGERTPWHPDPSNSHMVATKSHTTTGSRIHYSATFGRLLNTSFSSPSGSASPYDCNWLSGEDAIGGGTMHHPSLSCTRAGSCSSDVTIAWGCFVPSVGSIWSLGALCLWLFGYTKIPNGTRWTKPSSLPFWNRTRIAIRRSLRGAGKLHRQQRSQTRASTHLEQALSACFLPAILSLILLSGSTHLIGCRVLQAAHGCTRQPAATMCPQPFHPNTGIALRTIRLICVALLCKARQCSLGKAQGTASNLWDKLIMATKSGTGPGEASSSEEYVEVQIEPEATEGRGVAGDSGEGPPSEGLDVPIPVPVWMQAPSASTSHMRWGRPLA